MPSRLPNALIVTSALLLTACGGGGSSAPAPAEPTLQERTSAVEQTVSNNARCTILSPFYWEIGDKDGALASGAGGDGSAPAPTATTLMAIASASKWVFASWVLQKLYDDSQAITTDQIQKLNFTSLYNQMNHSPCMSAGHTLTQVDACLQSPLTHGDDPDPDSSDLGKFDYNSGHMEVLAHDLGLGGDYDQSGQPQLSDDINPVLGSDLNFFYSNPVLAGGITTTAANYAIFLRKLLNDDLVMHDALGSHAVCAWLNQPDCDALASPLSYPTSPTDPGLIDEKWHYSLGHWVEDDPVVGDGAFSSAGARGFYPWIDASKTWYGILARSEGTGSDNRLGTASIECGRLLRHAWITGAEQTGINP